MIEDFSEATLQAAVIELARLTGWKEHHNYDSRKTSSKGFPDLVMVRDGRMLAIELKSRKGKVSMEQAAWLDAFERVCGAESHVWRPEQWKDGTIEGVLK